MNHGVEVAPAQPRHQFGGRHEIGELPLGEIAPFATMAKHVADHDIRAAGIVERGHNVRSNKTGAAGHQQHSNPYPEVVRGKLCPSPVAQAIGACCTKANQRAGTALPAPDERLPTGYRRAASIKMNIDSKYAGQIE